MAEQTPTLERNSNSPAARDDVLIHRCSFRDGRLVVNDDPAALQAIENLTAGRPDLLDAQLAAIDATLGDNNERVEGLVERTARVNLRPVSRCPRIVQAILDTPWAITPDKLEAIAEFIELRAIHGYALPQAEIEAVSRDRAPPKVHGSVAVIPIQGVIGHRMNMMAAMSGGTSSEQVGRDLKAALDDPGVSSIVLDIDSPGGTVQGVQELADSIRAGRKQKPIVAVANALAASAAYWLASQATELVVTPSGAVGSIGVVTMHQDISKAAEAQGVRTTIIHAGKYKAEGNRYEPMSADARAAAQEQIDTFYDQFVNSVARGRGVDASSVRSGFGEGRVVLAKAAVKQGMADSVATMDDTISRLLTPRSAVPQRQGASLEAMRRRLKLRA